MNFNSVKVWTIGIVILCVALLLGTVLLGAKPKFDEVADMNSEREDVEFMNEKLQAEVNKLKKMEDGLPQTREEIAALQVGIPTAADVDKLLIQIGDLATEHDLVLKTTSVQLPQGYTENAPAPTETVAPEPEPEGDPGEAPEPVAPGEAEEKEPATTTASKPAGEDLLQEFYLLTFTVDLTGSYEDALAFVDELQVESERHILVFDLGLQGILEEGEDTFGIQDIEIGDVDFQITGTAYALEGTQQPEEPDAEPAEEPDMPQPGANDNPFMPLENLPAPAEGQPEP